MIKLFFDKKCKNDSLYEKLIDEKKEEKYNKNLALNLPPNEYHWSRAGRLQCLGSN